MFSARLLNFKLLVCCGKDTSERWGSCNFTGHVFFSYLTQLTKGIRGWGGVVGRKVVWVGGPENWHVLGAKPEKCVGIT